MTTPQPPPEKVVHPGFRALGRGKLPDPLDLPGQEYRLVEIFKHDFWAITARYRSASREVVLKVNRRAPCFGIPLRWTGRILARREARMYCRLAGIAGVPRFLGRWRSTGLVHEYVEGRRLRRGEDLSEDFVARLRGLLDAIHGRGVAYVDLEKAANVIRGADDHPYLVDFQISFHWPGRWGGGSWPARQLLRILQSADRYHLVKQVSFSRADLLREEELRLVREPPWFIRLHRALTGPLGSVRRALLDRMDPHRVRESSPPDHRKPSA